MADENQAAAPSVVLEANNLGARVLLPAGVDQQTLSVYLLVSLARERGVEMTRAAEAALAAAIDRYKAGGEPVEEVFIRAILPEHGEAGHIEWMPGYNPDRSHERELEHGEERVDFYSHQSFVKVRKEDHIATVHAPTQGADGRDVTGRTIPAIPGKPVALSLDDSLLQLADGKILARLDGLLCFDGKKVCVDPVLDIKGTVDFSTGNIDFDGDVVIHRDIRDKFRVRSTGSVTIGGIIDASHIECGGTLTARRGVAGRDEGTLTVGGDAHIGYADRVSGRIRGTLYLAREMMHSRVAVGGDLLSDAGVVVGGRTSVAGDVRVADLGSGSDTPTELRLGAPPDANSPAGRAAAQVTRLRARIEEMRREMHIVKASAGPNNPTAAERLKELTLEVADREGQITALEEQHPELTTGRHAAGCHSTLVVSRQIHGRVTLTIGPHTVYFASPVKGPVRVWLEGTKTVMCQIGEGNPQPIRSLSGVIDRAAA